MASSSRAIIPREKRYDVFLSFSREDTCSGFISHLHKALISKRISTFINYGLRRGDDIFPTLLTRIEESKISVIIFSPNYANSKRCLKELEKIFECKELYYQVVIPVFYEVDPSDVKKQTGKFGVAFDELKERLAEGEMDLNKVRSHLKEAATISEWNSHDISSESKLLKSIVRDILNKLKGMKLNLPSKLVGIGSHVEHVESLLCLELPELCIFGLWGMSGIGKTTVAQSVFRHISSRFDGFYFVEKVSEKLKHQSVDDLRKEIVSKLFEEEILSMGSRTLQLDFITKQLPRKRVLVVLDDVDDAIEVMKLFPGENDRLFSKGSRILVTSRDRRVLKNIVGDENLIYEVEGLNQKDSLQLFSLCAFKKNHPISDRLELSNKVLSYASGNPLALVVLGDALFDKSIEEWHSVIKGLEKEPFRDIEKVMRIDYDLLREEEKMIFLDMASLLAGKSWDSVLDYYNGRVYGIEYMISDLIDKCLITRRGEILEMHDLLKEMGRSIQTTEKIHRRIVDLKDVTQGAKEWAWGWVVMSFLFEGFSATFDQLGYTLTGMVMAYVGLLLFVVELTFKARKKMSTWAVDRTSLLPRYRRLSAPAHNVMFQVSVVELFGLASAIWQCFYSTMHYMYKSHNPLNICLLPFLFVSCVTVSKCIREREKKRQE